MITVEVAFADVTQQALVTLTVSQPCTVRKAIQCSGLLQRFPQLDLKYIKVGIFSEMVEQERILEAGDRVEIYTPLLIDPKVARRQRAKN